MHKVNPYSNLQGLQAAQEASADYKLEQKGSKRAQEAKAKESGSTNASNNELVRCAENMSVVIDKWDTQLRNNLEEWYQEAEEMAELTSDLNELTQELSDMTDNAQGVADAYNSLVPEKGDNKVLYEDEAAVEFAEAMIAAGLGDTIVFSNVTINSQTGYSGYYYLTPNEFLGYVSDYQKSHNGELPSMEVRVQPHSDNGKESPSPEELQDMILESTDFMSDYKSVQAQIEDINNQISALKSDQTKTMFKVMQSYSFKNANIESLTSLMKNLSDNSRNMLNNVQ